VSRTRDMATR